MTHKNTGQKSHYCTCDMSEFNYEFSYKNNFLKKKPSKDSRSGAPFKNTV